MVEQRVRGTDMWPTCPVRARGKSGEGVSARRERAQEARGRARNRERGAADISINTHLGRRRATQAGGQHRRHHRPGVHGHCVRVYVWVDVGAQAADVRCVSWRARTHTQLSARAPERRVQEKTQPPITPITRAGDTVADPRPPTPPTLPHPRYRRPRRTLSGHSFDEGIRFFLQDKNSESPGCADRSTSPPPPPPPPPSLFFSLSPPPQKNSGLCVWVWVGLEGGGDS